MKFEYIGQGCKLAIALMLKPFLKIKYRNNEIWLIGERKNEAKDNGYHLFKYIRKNKPKDKVYYTISKDSYDYDRIKNLGNIIIYDSLKHYIYFVLAEKLIGAHIGSNVPDTPVVWKMYRLLVAKKKKIFIQHGITKEYIPSLMSENTDLDMFVCGARDEYEYIKAEYGYDEDSVKYLGFARFDNLHNYNVKRQILLMPTWRQWFGMTDENKVSEDSFKVDEYFKVFQSLINNSRLRGILDKYDYEFIFYPHYEMQRYRDCFSTNITNLIIADNDSFDVQQLLKESKILITDYSSIAFDFAYMRKALVYYQFDSEKYFEKHYSKGYFDYERDGFGPVAKVEEELLDRIENIIIESEMKEKYRDRAERFFPLFDNKNCERHYNEIYMI